MIIPIIEAFSFLSIFPFFETQFMYRYSIIGKIVEIIQFSTIAYCIFLYLSGKRKISTITVFTLVLQTELLIVSISNGRNPIDTIKAISVYCYVSMVWDMFSDRIDTLLRYIVVYSKAIVYGNAISMIIFRNGIVTLINPPYSPEPLWLIGVSNSFVFWLYPMIILLMLDYYIHNNKKSLIAVVVAVLMIVFSSSTTGLVGTTIFMVIVLIPKLKRVLSPIRIALVGASLFVLIIIVGKSSFLEPIVVGVLGKDMSFSTRTNIWENAFEAIRQKMILGYGLLKSEDMILILGKTPMGLYAGTATHCHSEYLQLAFKYGLFGGIIFAVLLSIALIKCTKENSDSSLAIGVGVAVIFIMGITEVFSYQLFYFLLVLAFSVEKLKEISDIKAEERYGII